MANVTAHVFYVDGDRDAPRAILDRNGEVVLDMCRVCGLAEGELAEACPGDPRDKEIVRLREALRIAEAIRDDARAASARDLEARRLAEHENLKIHVGNRRMGDGAPLAQSPLEMAAVRYREAVAKFNALDCDDCDKAHGGLCPSCDRDEHRALARVVRDACSAFLDAGRGYNGQLYALDLPRSP